MLCSGVKVTLPNKTITVHAKLLYVVADLPAKAILLNCNQYNGAYGCNHCTIEGHQVICAVVSNVARCSLCLLCQ